MPQPPTPPFVPAALTYPRMLQRWLDLNYQGGPLGRTMTYVTLPSFVQNTNSWNGYSDIVLSFNFEGPNNFSLRPIPAALVATVANFVLCISWQADGVITRYMIWNAVGSVMNQEIPMYNGQLIKKNFRFEIWNTSQGVVSFSSAVNFYTSVLNPIDYRYAQDSALIGSDPACTSFTDSVNGIPTGNPDASLYMWDWTSISEENIAGLPSYNIQWNNFPFEGSELLTATGVGYKQSGYANIGILNLAVTDNPSLYYFTMTAASLASGNVVIGNFTISYDGSGHLIVSLSSVTKITVPFDLSIYTNITLVFYFANPEVDTVSLDLYSSGAFLSTHSATGVGQLAFTGSVQLNALYMTNWGYSNTLTASTALVAYLYQAYNLPLTFPANAISATN